MIGSNPWGKVVRPTTHLHLVLRLRITRAKLPLPLHTFMACTGKKLPFILKVLMLFMVFHEIP